MDCTAAASHLKTLLVAHGNAGTQISALDEHINDVSQQTLVSALDGNKAQDLHLSLRLSVCEGVKVMYDKYQSKKWSQVQETARNIIQNLEGDTDSEQTSLPMTSPQPGGRQGVDKAADKWSMAFCEFYRDS